jgi:hypothetical protein
MPLSETSVLLDDLKARLERLTDVARQEGRAQALNEIRSLVGGDVAVKRGPGRPPKAETMAAPAQPRKRRRNSWSGLTPEQRLVRVNAIRKGKGLPPKSL